MGQFLSFVVSYTMFVVAGLFLTAALGFAVWQHTIPSLICGLLTVAVVKLMLVWDEYVTGHKLNL